MNKVLTAFISCSLALTLLIALPDNSCAQWGDPEFVNQLITGVAAPVFSPGENAILSLNLSNPFSSTISEISILAEPYLIVYENGESDWSGVVAPPKLINLTANSSMIHITTMLPKEKIKLGWSVITTEATSRGSLFAQSVYLVRLSLSFNVTDQRVHYTSKGFLTDSQWDELTISDKKDSTIFNNTYLSELGYEGIIPDVSFIVRDKMPLWPAISIVGVSFITGLLAVYYHLKSDPMAAPRLYRILVNTRNGIERIIPFRKKK